MAYTFSWRGVSHKHGHGGGSWDGPGWCLALAKLQKTELAASGDLVGLWWNWGETQETDISTNICEKEASEIYRGSM